MLVKMLACAAVLSLLFVAAGDTAGPAKGIAYFRQVPLTYHTEGAFPGATEVWTARVLLLHQPKRAGSIGIACIHVTKTIRECFGTVVLPLGRIKLQGEITNRNLYQLVIVGGLGYYAGVTGVAIFQPGLLSFLIT